MLGLQQLGLKKFWVAMAWVEKFLVAKFWVVQGLSSLGVFFKLDILGTLEGAVVFFLGSN